MKAEKMKSAPGVPLARWSFLPRSSWQAVASRPSQRVCPQDGGKSPFQASVSRVATSASKFLVKFSNPSRQGITVGLTAADGSCHFEVQLFAKSYSCLFDFSGVATGWYTIIVANDHHRTIRKVFIPEEIVDSLER